MKARIAKQVLVASLSRAISRDQKIEYFLGTDSGIIETALFEYSRTRTGGMIALVQVKYLAWLTSVNPLKQYLYEAVSDYWRDHGIEYGPSRFPYPLRRDMCALALAEHLDPMALVCQDCQGSGRIAKKIGCKVCQGSGRIIFTDLDRALALGLPTHLFKYTWVEFYKAIQQILTDWERLALVECRDRDN